jgi:integrase
MKGLTIERSPGKWSYVIDLGRDASGKRLRHWQSGFTSEKLAQAALNEALVARQRNTFKKPSRETLGAFLDRWLLAIRSNLRPTTIGAYEWAVNKHIKPRIGHVRLADVSTSRLNQFYGDLRAAGLGDRSVRYAHVTLRKALGDAQRWEDLDRNPAALAQAPGSGSKREMRTWGAEEMRTFLFAAREDRLAGAFTLIATTGLRRGELLGLRWQDLDLRAGWLQVVQSLTVVRYKLMISQPKTERSRRMVALDPGTVQALAAHRVRMMEERRLTRLPAIAPQDLVFTTMDGDPVHPETFADTFDHYVRAAGLPRLTLHGLRHSHATMALRAGLHPKVIQERLGHSSIGVTMNTYAHAIPALQSEAAAKVADLIFQDGG